MNPVHDCCVVAVPTNRVFLRRALQRQLKKAEIFEAQNGAVAVDLVREDLSRFNVICMDKEMPVRYMMVLLSCF